MADDEGDGGGLHEPYYVRSPDCRYCLRSNPAYGWATGVAEDGSQVQHCQRNWLVFNPDGDLLRAGEQAVPFRDGPIEVRRFWLPDRWMGIEYLEDPEEAEPRQEDVGGWIRDAQFQFYPGYGDYIKGQRGGVVAAAGVAPGPRVAQSSKGPTPTGVAPRRMNRLAADARRSKGCCGSASSGRTSRTGS